MEDKKLYVTSATKFEFCLMVMYTDLVKSHRSYLKLNIDEK